MIIAVDFDGTIVEHRYPAIGKEVPFAVDVLKKLTEDGHRLILWTSREGELLDEAVEWCRQRGLTFFAVNSENPEARWDKGPAARKIVADMYIDDRNLGGLPRWPLIYDMVSKKMNFGDMMEESYVDDDADSHSHHHHHHRRKKKSGGMFGWFRRLRERTREARAKYNRTSSGSHHASRHW